MQDSLAHYGVKGMRWGKRKARPTVRVSTDRKAANAALGRPVTSLSNKQIKTANTRLELEKKYNDLNKKPGTIDKINKGNNSVKAIIGIGATAITIYNMANHEATRKGAQFIKNAWAAANASGAPGPRDAGYWAATRVAQKALGS